MIASGNVGGTASASPPVEYAAGSACRTHSTRSGSASGSLVESFAATVAPGLNLLAVSSAKRNSAIVGQKFVGGLSVQSSCKVSPAPSREPSGNNRPNHV